MANSKLILVLWIALLSGCYSHKKSINSSLPYSKQIEWPDAYIPEEAKFFVHNEIAIDASPEVVWELLNDAENWPSWYEGASNVVIAPPSESVLSSDAVFTWQTMGLDFVSTVTEFEKPYRLSWESTRKSISGYHAWLIIPTDAGCKLITDESQYGPLTFMQKVFVPNKLRKLHDVWLAEFKRKAESK